MSCELPLPATVVMIFGHRLTEEHPGGIYCRQDIVIFDNVVAAYKHAHVMS